MPDVMAEPTVGLGWHPHVLATLAVVLAALLLGTVVRSFATYRDEAQRRQRLASLRTWWMLFLLLSAAILAGRYGVVALFLVASLVGLREYRRLVAGRIDDRLWRWALGAVPVHYWFLAQGKLAPFWTLIPVWVLGLLLVRLVVGAEIPRFLETVGTVFLGLMILVYLFSHAALMVSLPVVPETSGAGGMGLFLYLVILTESNDIAQALWGRKFGKHAITPLVSPHKTWEGFWLGMASTVALAAVLAPALTPLDSSPLALCGRQIRVPFLPAVLAGVLIACGGFFGDVTISAIKREVGVKDSGALLPGMGGILDRIDSLTFTGPLLFYFVYVCCG